MVGEWSLAPNGASGRRQLKGSGAPDKGRSAVAPGWHEPGFRASLSCVGWSCRVRSGSCREDLFAEDVGVSGVLRKFSKNLEEQCPDCVLSAAVDNCVEFEFGHGLTRLLAALLVCLLN